ncbi:transposase [Anabaena sp. UHCC 0399]|uniref:transposase n=1 Tax=Anabaena sp. UHCC 0399 TaxID=3110238 RepID=UPI002B1FEDD1|nr:transposase [Anabaena sp. UHCC 0399]MEA5568028.1 transposase [Anabaena sp. UHCC 0399]
MRKLTNPDKQEILKLYRETAETTSTLAERYDVSNSTISRLLKSTLPEDEYEYLVSLKRAARTPEGRAQVSYEQVPAFVQPEPEVPAKSQEKPRLKSPEVEQPRQVEQPVASPDQEEEDKQIHPVRRVRKRAVTEAEVKPKPKQPIVKQLEIPVEQPQEITSIPIPLLEDDKSDVTAIARMLGEDLLDESEDLDDEEDLEDDLEDEDDYEEDEEYFEQPRPLVSRRRMGEIPVQVLPLSVAALPKTCYLVIDRSSELITRPLKDFGDLGQIPSLENQQRTLPVFDNHRVAKRFSTKRDRVIKVPDSKMLHKARTHLQAKGITRLLIDGQVYSLSLV